MLGLNKNTGFNIIFGYINLLDKTPKV